jgi:hypothetical protein
MLAGLREACGGWLFVSAAHFERLIAHDRRALQWYLSYTFAMVALGVLLVFLSFLLALSSAAAELLLRVGGGFAASLGALPLRELIERASRIRGIRDMEEMWREILSSDEPSQEQVARIDDFIWRAYEKRALG